MKRSFIAALAGLGALAAGGAQAQDRSTSSGPFGEGWRGGHSLSAEDRAAFADARIAALHAGLKLSAEQQKLWPPVEQAIRALLQQRREARQARRERFSAMRQDGAAQDLPGALRVVAERQAASAEALRKLADASQPLYASLDEAQKRRLTMLSRGLMRGMAGHRWRGERGRDEDGSLRRG